ncbi:unnamed protein product [Diatraea saccharalis]|uniref:CCHC-type domain-containing protein n=1 Tax=Diatraea saccharalis TaxID=40085 RepID=A0A9N9N1I9_9NEOP|nr:unnamed protein product [Diatraea saccharalis]
MGDIKHNTVMARFLAEEENKKKIMGYGINNRDITPSAFNCYKCGKSGHKKYQCYIGHGNNKKNFLQGNTGRNFNTEQRQGSCRRGYSHTGQGFYNERERQNINQRRRTKDNIPSAFFCGPYKHEDKGNDEIQFYIDLGCTDHLINSKEYFVDYIQLKKPKKILLLKMQLVWKL